MQSCDCHPTSISSTHLEEAVCSPSSLETLANVPTVQPYVSTSDDCLAKPDYYNGYPEESLVESLVEAESHSSTNTASTATPLASIDYNLTSSSSSSSSSSSEDSRNAFHHQGMRQAFLQAKRNAVDAFTPKQTKEEQISSLDEHVVQIEKCDDEAMWWTTQRRPPSYSMKKLQLHGGYVSKWKQLSNSLPCTVQSRLEGREGTDGTAAAAAAVTGYIPSNPYNLTRAMQILLQISELPFLILWVYLAYFVVIVSLTAPHVRQLVWLNATVAGLLVGIGLNANAYHAIMYRGSLDVGMVVRFFLIPFGVSALSGLTNNLRERFMLVFPKNSVHLTIAILTPAALITALLLARLLVLYKWRVPVTLRNLLLNGKVYQ